MTYPVKNLLSDKNEVMKKLLANQRNGEKNPILSNLVLVMGIETNLTERKQTLR